MHVLPKAPKFLSRALRDSLNRSVLGATGLAACNVAVCCCAAPILAQAGAPVKVPTFDAVSIRQYLGPIPHDFDWQLRPDGYHGHAIPMLTLILTAYRPSQGTQSFSPDDVIGLPDWMNHSIWDVDVKVADADVAAWQQPDVRQAMLQAALADRLKLTAHRETRMLPAYELHIAKGGVRFKPAAASDAAAIVARHPGASPYGAAGDFMAPGANPNESLILNASIETLCKALRHMAGRQVVDKTGLTGRYDMLVQFEPPDGFSSPHDPLDSVLYEVQQLGLRLDPAKAPVEVLVIDHADRPSAN